MLHYENENLKEGFIGTADQYIPELVDTEFILTGWRCNYRSRFEVFMTLFKWHNETINVWSHYLGALLAFLIIAIIFFLYPDMMKDATALDHKFSESMISNNNGAQL